MQKKGRFFLVFLIFLLLSIGILSLSFFDKLSGALPFLEEKVSYVPKTAYALFQSLPFFFKNEETEKLKNENLDLFSALADYERLKKENAALLSQLNTENVRTDNLLPARVIGAPGFVPGITIPSHLILDKGSLDDVKIGNSVVFKDNLVGRVGRVSYYLSEVDLVTHPSFAFPVATINGATGVVKGEGEDKMTIDNVLLSENLEIGDFVFTKGDMDIEGRGTPPNLIVGKIESVEKVPTAIFQKGNLKSLLDFGSLSTVFIVITP